MNFKNYLLITVNDTIIILDCYRIKHPITSHVKVLSLCLLFSFL